MIWFVTNVDTEVLALRTAVEALPEGFDEVRAFQADLLPDLSDGALPGSPRAVIVRLLGGRRAATEAFDELRRACVARDVLFMAFPGDATPDAELAEASTVPSGLYADAFLYLLNGGAANIAHLLRFLADTLLLEGFGFDPPTEVPLNGVWRQPASIDASRPVVAVLFYRAHLVAGNTQFVTDLCDAIEAQGGQAVAVWAYSVRGEAAQPALDLIRGLNAEVLVTSVLATGGAAGGAGVVGEAGGIGGEDWDVEALAALGVPVIQTPTSSRSRADWEASDVGLGPYEATSGIAVPELDGRIIAPAYAFSEVVDDGDELGIEVRALRVVPDRVARVAGIALRFARLRRTPARDRRIAIVLSAYPTKRSRLGNAVGLDTPASAMALLDALKDAGYDVRNEPASGDELLQQLADGLTYDAESLNAAQLAMAIGGMATGEYTDWFESLSPAACAEVTSTWGEAPGAQRIHKGSLVFSGVELGNVVVAIQPPRGYGDDPVAVYHSPNLPPAHHYLAFYRWLDESWGADAIIHLGKHGTLEWLPGKSLAPSADCWPDAALGDVPFFYPFLINDPGEGAQAKRRTHAVVIDHLLPPMTRADSYDDLARIEQLFDEYAQVSVLDPGKLPALRTRIWATLTNASIDRDLGIEAPSDDNFDQVIADVDGYLCSLKDAQIRGGLHTLGQAPTGETLIDLVLAITRLANGSVPSLRGVVAQERGLDLDDLRQLERIEAECRMLVEDASARRWLTDESDGETMQWVCQWLIPRLAQTTDEISNLLVGLDGGYVPAGPSGALTRGGAHVLPTGRNFYAVDPKALPTELSWDVGVRLADELIARHRDETREYPRHVALVLWGTAMMRTQGDDIAEALALLGVRPVWEAASRRVVSLRLIPLAELGRPRIDVTLRISGFFRDAFPNLVQLVDDAIALVANADETSADNPLRGESATEERIFGPQPGSYGSGIGQLLEGGSWRTDDDLAAVYLAWSGYAYSRGQWGAPAEGAMRSRLGTIDVAVKNQDNREHDIFDSGDYLSDHGGLVATIRSLTGANPRAWLGDSSDPSRPRVRSLEEEAARVVRTRVVNPKWIQAMMRHGYKGAFEMAATVDFLFGYDVAAHAVEDWIYESVTQAYVNDPEVRKFFEASNPGALEDIANRLLEAVDRGVWEATAESLGILRAALVDAERWSEERSNASLT